MEKKLPRRLEGKIVIVTASTQGIGFGIIECFGLESASVVVSSRKQANVDEAVEKLKSKGVDAYGIVYHVSNAQHRQNIVEKNIQRVRVDEDMTDSMESNTLEVGINGNFKKMIGDKIQVPVKFMTGDFDMVYTIPNIKEYIHDGGFATDVPNIQEIVVIKDAGYFVNQEKPQEVIAHINEFFTKLQNNNKSF